MSIVWLGAAKLIIRNCRTGASGCWATGQILELTASSDIPDKDIEFAIRPEGEDTAIVIAARRLSLITLIGRLGRSIILEGAQFDQVEIKGKHVAVPNEAINAIAQQRHCQYITTIRAKLGCIFAFCLRGEEWIFSRWRGCDTAPVKIDKMTGCEIWVQSNSQ